MLRENGKWRRDEVW